MIIYLEPIGGLCNRMRSIASGYQFALENKYELVIIWTKKQELNCSFNKLFSCIKLNNKAVTIINLPYVGPGFVNIGHYRISEIIKNKYKRKSKYIFNDSLGEYEKNANIYISSYSEWYSLPDNVYKIFKLNNKLKILINSYKLRFNNQTIGVHIRRSDNTESIYYSPSQLYYNYMNKVIANNKESIFYVATDDEKELNKIYELFGTERIISQQKISRRRDSSKGIISAVVDLYLLAECKEIIGSYYSSFTDVAAQINGIKLHVIKKDNQEECCDISNNTCI